ncbi:MAG: sulfite exporter TauE/SafE family protein [Rhodobacteraceae bacterium]|nr:sulfite exporter TauE/SafE family protein [Paracoccaceae bacterium]
MEPHLLIALICLALSAGFIKGITGFAFPMIMFSGMSVFLEPGEAVALLAFPLLAVNLLQAFQFGPAAARREIRACLPMTVALCIAIIAAAPLVNILEPAQLFTVLGLVITVTAAIQLVGVRLRLPAHLHRPGAIAAGIAAGFCGGFAGVWAPLIVLFLLALEIDKQTQIVRQGIIYSAGSLVLIAAHHRTGVLGAENLPLSLLLILPAVLGLGAGAIVLSRLNRTVFVKATLLVLIAAGINLLWRAVS